MLNVLKSCARIMVTQLDEVKVSKCYVANCVVIVIVDDITAALLLMLLLQ